MVKSHQAGSAHDAMTPIRDVLEDTNFLESFNLELQNHLDKIPWLKVKKHAIKYNLREDESTIVATANEHTTLFIGSTYALNSTFRQLEVVAYVKMVDKPANNQPQRVLYANEFYFVNRLSDINKEKNLNKDRWLKKTAHYLKLSFTMQLHF